MSDLTTDFQSWLQEARQGVEYTFPNAQMTIRHRKVTLLDLAAHGQLPDGYEQDFHDLMQQSQRRQTDNETTTADGDATGFQQNAKMLLLAEALLRDHWLYPEITDEQRNEAIGYLGAEDKLTWFMSLVEGGTAADTFPEGGDTETSAAPVAMDAAPSRQRLRVSAQHARQRRTGQDAVRSVGTPPGQPDRGETAGDGQQGETQTYAGETVGGAAGTTQRIG